MIRNVVRLSEHHGSHRLIYLSCHSEPKLALLEAMHAMTDQVASMRYADANAASDTAIAELQMSLSAQAGAYEVKGTVRIEGETIPVDGRIDNPSRFAEV